MVLIAGRRLILSEEAAWSIGACDARYMDGGSSFWLSMDIALRGGLRRGLAAMRRRNLRREYRIFSRPRNRVVKIGCLVILLAEI